MLQLDDLVLARQGFTLCADLSLKPGITALLGPSGAGKSTLLDAIAGFIAPRSGRILWRGEDITESRPAARPCAIVFQDNNLFPHLTVAENLALACPRDTHDKAARVSNALRDVSLTGYADRKPAALSGGQQARVALTRALLQSRPILLLDEAFAALGPALKANMLDLVAAQAHARALQVIMVSHDPEDAARIADHVAVVADGVVSAPIPTSDLLNEPPQALRDYLGARAKENPPKP